MDLDHIVDLERPPGDDVYPAKRDAMASLRLATQHYMVREREGWLIHPTIQQELANLSAATTLKVADVACGNCMWALDVVKEHPHVEMTAFDLSAESFPPAWTLPLGISLELYNIFDQPPDNYQAYFDFVHVRFINGVVYKGGRDAVIRNLVSMLKPDGWLQWQDVCTPDIAPIALDTLMPLSESDWPRCVRIIDEMTGIWTNTKFFSQLDKILEDVGNLVNVKAFRPPIKKELLKLESDLFIWLYRESDRSLVSKASEEVQQEYRQSLDEEEEKVARGKLWSYQLIVAIGRRPIVD